MTVHTSRSEISEPNTREESSVIRRLEVFFCEKMGFQESQFSNADGKGGRSFRLDSWWVDITPPHPFIFLQVSYPVDTPVLQLRLTENGMSSLQPVVESEVGLVMLKILLMEFPELLTPMMHEFITRQEKILG